MYMKHTHIAIIIAAVAGMALASCTAFADSAPQQARTAPQGWGNREGMMQRRAPGVFGTVSAISGSTLTVTATQPPMRPQTGTTQPSAVTYSVDASTATVMKDQATSTLSAIVVGDTVMVQGTINGSSVSATLIRDGVAQGRGMGMMNRGEDLGDIRGRVHGFVGTSTEAIAALQGNGQPVVGGTVTAIAGSTLTITNKSNVTYTVDTSSATFVKAGATSTLSSIATGDTVMVQGAVHGSAVTASSVIDHGVAPASLQPNGAMPIPAKGGFMGMFGNIFHRLFGFF